MLLQYARNSLYWGWGGGEETGALSSFTAGHEHFKADQAKRGTSGELKRAGMVSAFGKLLCCLAPQVHAVSNAWNI